MNNLPPDDLLGYVLGALDADQQDALQKRLDQQPQLEEQLLDIKASLNPLELLDEPGGCRPGLARRTCELVSTIRNGSGEDGVVVAPSRKLPSQFDSLGARGSWSMREFAVTVASVAVVLALLLPAVAHNREQSRRFQCENNLRSLGVALASFAASHEGQFIDIPESGPLAFSGLYAPMLKDAQYVEDDSLFFCASVPRDEPLRIPTCEQITQCSSVRQYDRLRRIAGGDYGYSQGYTQNGRFCPPSNEGNAFQVLLADKPPRMIGGPSENHGGDGQNCLLGDFSVRYVSGCTLGEDCLFVNDQNLVGPGIGPYDSVIAASHVPPAR